MTVRIPRQGRGTPERRNRSSSESFSTVALKGCSDEKDGQEGTEFEEYFYTIVFDTAYCTQ